MRGYTPLSHHGPAALDHTTEWKTCVGCGGRFTLEPGERVWYRAKGFALPTRCKPCRRHRKAATSQTRSEGRSR